MFDEYYPEHGHQKHLHCPFDQAAESQHIPQHDACCHLRVVEALHITFDGQLRGHVLVTYHGLYQVFSSRLFGAIGGLNLCLA
ncbi:hypothetical protein D3C78_1148800 [compost metagenome]